MNIVGYQPYTDLGDGLTEHEPYLLCPACARTEDFAQTMVDDNLSLTPLYEFEGYQDSVCDTCGENLIG